ncbi:hypothetical protein M427DRAFT_51304 [Gonapodya prolifera JEL478]|uniref:Uncharacterized protein n=1 Tax=Gonapodya prolifera (strain JEL478) TaxID=1344416 RepID=A0A139AYW8_GONPJ|nr:hypothetical protein M427DRAFT_51304 [Gonapodya prolifera JEL478]|eukprot:KXS21931.1 hypothetical protein M427DRAFT_51304 [Gonapodya prolifera JEL478]
MEGGGMKVERERVDKGDEWSALEEVYGRALEKVEEEVKGMKKDNGKNGKDVQEGGDVVELDDEDAMVTGEDDESDAGAEKSGEVEMKDVDSDSSDDGTSDSDGEDSGSSESSESEPAQAEGGLAPMELDKGQPTSSTDSDSDSDSDDSDDDSDSASESPANSDQDSGHPTPKSTGKNRKPPPMIAQAFSQGTEIHAKDEALKKAVEGLMSDLETLMEKEREKLGFGG